MAAVSETEEYRLYKLSRVVALGDEVCTQPAAPSVKCLSLFPSHTFFCLLWSLILPGIESEPPLCARVRPRRRCKVTHHVALKLAPSMAEVIGSSRDSLLAALGGCIRWSRWHAPTSARHSGRTNWFCGTTMPPGHRSFAFSTGSPTSLADALKPSALIGLPSGSSVSATKAGEKP